jgi:hypothetical protein
VKPRALLGTLAVASALAVVPAHADRNCAWQARLDPAIVNTAYPDQFANYWVSVLPAVPDARLTITGTYPHARYMSFVSYAATLQSADGLADVNVAPDPGSANPFVAGNARDTTDANRRYTVHVVFGNAPAQRAGNTLYTGNADSSKNGQTFTLIYRVYRPDDAFKDDITGGVGLPAVAYNGTPIPACPLQDPPGNDLNQTVANQGGQNSGGTLMHPGFNPPRWHKFQNFARSLSQGVTENGYWGTTFSDAAKPAADALPNGGFADNPDNNYVFTLLSHGYGQLAVFQAQLPQTPDTAAATTMPIGDLRYWSMCSNDGPSQRYFACVMDDGVRPYLDANGRYTIVVSTPADRPAGIETPHGREACRCVWVPWGPGGSAVMILRNMLPDPGFTNAIQFARYGFEQTDMGAYYPTGCYLTKIAFENGTRCN